MGYMVREEEKVMEFIGWISLQNWPSMRVMSDCSPLQSTEFEEIGAYKNFDDSPVDLKIL